MSQSTCPHCGGPLPIGSVRCPHCAGDVGNAASPPGFAGAAPPTSAGDRVWTVHDLGRQFGPYTEVELAALLAAGSLSPNAMAWTPSSPHWLPIAAVAPRPMPGPMNTLGGSTFDYFQAQPNPSPAITVPLLVSGIFHLLYAVGFFMPCFGLISMPLVVLAIFELRLFANSSKLAPYEFLASARTLAILEIISAITLNIPSLVCGIVILANIPRLPRQRFGY